MAIRITDSIAPGYERVPLGEVGKTAPPGASGQVGSSVLNQAQAAKLNMASIAQAQSSAVYATLDPNLIGPFCVYSEGNLRATRTGPGNRHMAAATIRRTTGKHYFEIRSRHTTALNGNGIELFLYNSAPTPCSAA
jgi:hypothetical protein